MKTLELGDSDREVIKIKEKLAAQGFWPENQMSEKFTPKLKKAVEYFQITHLETSGLPLIVDGVVGPETWWALNHPTGKAQKSGIPEDAIPWGIGPDRDKVLRIALGEHGVKEQPNGSNRGPQVDKYLPAWCKKEGQKGPAWCCFFVSWVLYEALGYHPLGRRYGSCKKAWEAARKLKMTISISKPDLDLDMVTPGDLFVMLRSNGTGHIGFVYRVSTASPRINTIEGNCGNRVKIGMRDIYKEPMYGFINFCGDPFVSAFEKGLIITTNSSRDTTR